MDLDLPKGLMKPAGYVVMQPNLYGGQVTKAYERWLRRLPLVYSEKLLDRAAAPGLSIHNDPYALAILKHYRSLMPMAHNARKPIFRLTAADGAIGAHWSAVQQAGADFNRLAQALQQRLTVEH